MFQLGLEEYLEVQLVDREEVDRENLIENFKEETTIYTILMLPLKVS